MEGGVPPCLFVAIFLPSSKKVPFHCGVVRVFLSSDGDFTTFRQLPASLQSLSKHWITAPVISEALQ